MTRPSRRHFVTCAASALLLLATAACGPFGDDDEAADGGPSFTVAAAGDILIHPQLTDQARKDAKATGKGEKGIDFGPLMAGVKPVISKADLGICHFEPVVGKPGGPFQSYPDFLVPPQIATAIKGVGYDQCSTASNHTLDHGPAGVTRTLDTLDKAGLRHTGSARSAAEANKPLITEVKGVKVGQIAFAFGFNGREVPKDKPWIVNQNDFDAIAAAEKKARKAGAEVVILSIHWGRENQPNASAPQIRLARKIATETGINLVIGHHAHVVQPMEKVDGTWIAYGLGNQVARHDVPSGLTEEGVVGWFEFVKRGGEWDVDAKYVPTFVDIPPDPDETGALPKGAVEDHRLLDVAATLRDGDGLSEQQRSRYRLAFERTQGTLLNRGASKDGLEPLEGLPAD
ncbi:PGA biosynthesis protein CapA [Streptomyces sp. WAC 01529]|uniref:CapA family protein n=1 Tax=Streptomyces sp. WAC 01529 TaxID=2203205 RepID=UPI000F6C14EB|nr:CapA family protein [Streptomyces sp. WAC 01529]AZM56108.1 PGA biosynthesis protein CapA [Streptomyces sp. WAC 01529]